MPKKDLISIAAPAALAGAASLFMELALIRYIPGQVRVLGYFTNFVLLAAFLGLGLGMLLSHRRPGVSGWARGAPLALLGLVGLTELSRWIIVGGSSEHFLFLDYQGQSAHVPLYGFLTAAFVALAAGFTPLGVAVGLTVRGERPLARYAANVLGSLLGVLLFALMASLSLPPWLWILLAGGLSLAVGARGASARWRAAGAAAALAAAGLTWHSTGEFTYSPYQKIGFGPVHLDDQRVVQEWRLARLPAHRRAALIELPRAAGFTVRVNDDSYQTPMGLGDAAVAAHPQLRDMRRQYDLPFLVRPDPGRVLVLGAGTGNDVAGMLRGGATHVDAVEIDPELVRLGQFHPDRPYADPRVAVHVTDARSFLARCPRRYDMIVFGLVDSHVLLSSKANVRLDSYVFTVESFRAARQCLTPRGVVLVSHAVGTPWFFERMRATLAAAFGKPPFTVRDKIPHPIGIAYLAGDVAPAGKPIAGEPPLLEDDWPFLYLKERAVPGQYLLALLLMGLISLGGVRAASGRRLAGMDLHFFAMGCGFLLMETRGLGVMALLLGSTWGVNAAVFASVLLMAFLATLAAARLARGGARPSPLTAYGALGALLLLNYLVPVSALTSLPAAAQVLAGGLLVSAPMLASGVIFGLSLARTGNADRAMASNLIGAMAGGMLEYLTMWTGFRFLLIVAALTYLLALGADLRSRTRS